MDIIIKRENCVEDSKLGKQAMMCGCVCWPRDNMRTKSSDLGLRRRRPKLKKKYVHFISRRPAHAHDDRLKRNEDKSTKMDF